MIKIFVIHKTNRNTRLMTDQPSTGKSTSGSMNLRDSETCNYFLHNMWTRTETHFGYLVSL